MESYTYPDENDFLTKRFIAAFEESDKYWIQSEDAVIELIKAQILANNSNRTKSFLDAGCGNGRLIPRFTAFFDKIVAIDPDPLRIANASELIKSLGMEHKTTFYHSLAENFSSDIKFDFILCSHVIQHIHTFSVKKLLKNLKAHLKEDGIMAITTCHSKRKYDQYFKNYLPDGKFAIEKINKVEYNLLVDGKGILPIHYFNSNALIKMLHEINLETFDFRVFHVDKDDRVKMHYNDIDAFVNENNHRQNLYGVDMCFIVRQL